MEELQQLIALHEARMAELNYPENVRREFRDARTKLFAYWVRRGLR